MWFYTAAIVNQQKNKSEKEFKIGHILVIDSQLRRRLALRWMFPNENSEHDGDKHDEHDDAAEGQRILLVILGLLQLYDALLCVLHRRLHIIVDAIEDSALVNNKNC